jgi:hypothetical protein
VIARAMLCGGCFDHALRPRRKSRGAWRVEALAKSARLKGVNSRVGRPDLVE